MFDGYLLPSQSKLSLAEDVTRAVARQRSRSSLKKSAAVTDDEPLEARRASSFDTSQMSANQLKLPQTSLRPGSFDVATTRMPSAFSPVEVPRLLVHSPASPLNNLSGNERRTPDNRLLTVPSPDFPRKTSVERSFGSESPKASDYLSMGLGQTFLGQLAMAASMNFNQHSMDTDPPKSSIVQLGQDHFRANMDCSSSLDTLASASLDIAGPSGVDPSNHSVSADLLATMPPKALIQDDIRSGQGRFQLVRKRGRSEVWNLFGQVLDTFTNSRLPYVACYACKVLYTDTGGGTGNMTRHRCPIGVSYRSTNHGSSTETVEASHMSSFESNVSTNNRSLEQKQTLSLSIVSDETNSGQLVSQTSGEVSIGEVDRELLTDAIVKCCAMDMLDPAVFSGRGFKGLFERVWFMSKRQTVSTLQDMFPDIQMISSSLQTNLRFCTDDLKNELSRTSQGVCLTLESLSYSGRDFKVVHGSRINHDWKWRSNVLGVFKARENQSLSEIVNHVVHNYELDRNLLRITCSRNSEEFAPLKTFLDVKEKLREILLAILTTSSVPILPMLSTVDSILKGLIDAEIRLPFDYKPCGEDIFNIHRMLAEWNDHHSSIEGIIKSKCLNQLQAFNTLNAGHLRDIEHFLDPFRETIDSLVEEKPNFHKVLPEWYALMHECQPSEDEQSPLLRDLKLKAIELLAREKENVITVEHRIAAILNPRLNRRMSPICTEQERQQTCDRIRALCGIRSPKEPLSRGSSTDGEPHRKRRMFLNALEDDPVGDDELECYLRSQYPTHQTKDLVTFWSTVGQSQFPSLASLARRTFSVPATAPKTEFDYRLASVAPDQLHTFLMLKSMFETERDD